jgi:3-phosphoshikimate 1-carboxyvinyltransferase
MRPLRGELRVPGDKSISHRAVLFPLLGTHAVTVVDRLRAGDVDASLRVVVALGARVEEHGNTLRIRPPERWTEPEGVLDCGNSGTTIRLVAGLVAAFDGFVVLDGDASLRQRPMARVLGPLREMGARVDGRRGASLPPFCVRGGGLRATDHVLPVASAQVKSALLLASRDCGGSVREPLPSRDHTERLLGAMGADLRLEDGALRLCPAPLRGVDVAVPGDLSAAAFPLVAATLCAGSELVLPRVGVNPSRAGVLEVLRAMGAELEVHPLPSLGGEPVADLHVRASALVGTEIRGDLALRALDELPVLAVAAAFAEGETVIADAAELRVKESDRIARVAAGLRALGIAVEERPDGMVIQGGRPRGPATVDATGDHRIAMAFAIADRAIGGGITLLGRESVASSWPAFFEVLDR